MPKLNLKIIIPIVAVLSLICLGTGALFYLKPKLSTDQVSTESGNISSLSTTLGMDSKEQKISFNQNQELYINGDYKGTSKEFALKIEDLKEGKNTLEFKGVKEYGPITNYSKNPIILEIVTDKTPPEATVSSEVPKFVLLEREIKLKLKTEIGVKILIGDKEILSTEKEQTEITLPVVDGKNDIKITTKDTFGNISKPLNVQFDSLLKDGWEKYKCGNIFLGINTNNVQRGFSDIAFYGSDNFGGAPRSKLTTEQSNYLNESRLGSCSAEYEKNGSFKLVINPKGSKLACFNCGAVPSPYLKFESNPESAKVKLDLSKKLIKTIDFKTKSGLIGKINEYFSPPFQSLGGNGNSISTKTFEVSQNNNIYQFTSMKQDPETAKDSVFYKNLDSDFQDLIDNLVFAS